MDRSQKNVRHWAYDVARYFHVDPTVVLRAWSVGDLVEATHALHTYEAVRAATQDRAEESQGSFGGRSPYGKWH